MRPRVATALAILALSAATPASLAQLVIEPPTHVLAPPPPVTPPKPTAKKRPLVAALAAPSVPATALPLIASESILATLTLSTFSAGSSDSGSVRAGTSWVGNFTLNADSLTVSGTALDENGWGATGLNLDASAMQSLLISARRDPGHAATTLFVQFEDLQLRTYVVSLSTSLFSSTALTSVTVPLNAWTVDFGPSQITGWSIGGGGLGTENFRMTFDTLSLSTSAIPEPSTYAALLGAAALALAAFRRRRS